MDELLLAKGVLDALIYKIQSGNESDMLHMIRLGFTCVELAQALEIDIETVRNSIRAATTIALPQEASGLSNSGDRGIEWDDVRDVQPPSISDLSNKSIDEAEEAATQGLGESHASQSHFVGHISQLLSHD